MRIISIVGKVDSRPLVYPLARALSMEGLTGIITDDGAYRRLYPGKEDIGSVNGIDISVTSHITDETVHSLDNSGVPYDTLITVSCDYIHPEADGVIVCHGVDRSMMLMEKAEEEDEFIIPQKVEAQEPEEAKEPKRGFGSGKAKRKVTDEAKETSDVPTETEEVTQVLEEPTTQVEETLHDKRIRLQNENPDKIVVPEDKKFVEVQIAYAAAPKKKDIIGISLKDGLVSYVYGCEEQKRITVNSDKNYVGILTKIGSTVTDIEPKELQALLIREEGSAAPTKSSMFKK